MRVNNFEEMQVWQKSKVLTLVIYKLFKNNKDFRFRDQILSASVSIMNNIAEGFERKGNKEFSRFLFISKGSCGEVRSMLYLSTELGYISSEEFKYLYELTTEVSRMLAGLIRVL